MIAIPEAFAAGIVNQAGDAGRNWIRQLPAVVESLCGRWNLRIDGAPMHGYLGLVVPVRRGAELCALKVSWIEASLAEEMSALATWNGHGAVRLLEVEPAMGAMLLERLDSRRSLHDVEIGRAVAIAGRLLRRLSVPAPDDLPRLKIVAERLWETLPERWHLLDRPFPRRILDAARDSAAQLGPSAGALMVNYDLHYGNVLAGEREPWLAIDPKVVAGDPEYGMAQLLWTRLEDMERAGGLSRHFHALVDHARLDLQRARSWTLVRCVDYWLWALSMGLTEDPTKCDVVTRWLVNGDPSKGASLLSHPPMSPEERFAVLVEALLGLDGVTHSSDASHAKQGFGSSGLKVHGRIFAMVTRGSLVVKIPRRRVEALVASGDGHRFDPGHGRLMKEWLALEPTSEVEWLPLATEAMEFVGSR